MKILKYKIIIITDSFGNKWADCYEDVYNNAQCSGLKLEDGSDFYIEDEIRTVKSHAELCGLTVEIRNKVEKL